MKRYRLLSAVSALTIGVSIPALATHSAEAGDIHFFEEIVVTAQKRESSLQDTPLAVTALTGATIEKSGTVTVQDIAAITPGLVVGGNAGFEYAISIRGISSAVAGSGADTPTGTYVDGVYLGRPVGAIFDLADIERIEVLRGPQGTLYGRNTVGGAVSVYTGKPSHEFEGKLRGTVAERGIRRIAGAVGGPVVEDTLNGRISVSYSSSDSWVENLTGSDLFDVESFIVRGVLEYMPSDDISFLLRADYGKVDDPFYGKNIATESVSPPAVTPDLLEDFNRVSLSDVSFMEREFYGTSLEVSVNFGEHILTSISAYRENEHVYETDTDGSPLRIFRSANRENQHQFSQELRLNSPGGETLDWILGAYFFTETVVQDFYVDVLPAAVNFGRFSKNKTSSYAAFGQADWHVSERLTATIGLRYSYESKDFGFTFQPTPLTPDQIGEAYDRIVLFPQRAPYVTDTESWSAVTGKVGLSWQLTDDALLYGSISQGFKSGGFNFAPVNPAGDAPFDQEDLIAYEVGVKADVFDGVARANLSAFYYDYKDLQVRIPIEPGVILIENASDARVYGGEFELQVRPLDRLLIQGSLAVLHTEYSAFVQTGGVIPLCTGGESGVTSQNIAFCDVSGNELNRAPSYTFNVVVEYTMPIGDTGYLVPRVSYSYEDSVFYTEQNDHVFGHDGYETLDASLTYRSGSEMWSVSVFGRNLTNDRIYTHVVPIGTAPMASGINEPRTFGVSVNLDF